MPQRRTLSLTKEQHRTLTDHRDHDSRPYVRERCAALLKIAGGQSPHGVAQHGLLQVRDPDAVYHWLNFYVVEGLKGEIAHHHGGERRGYL